MTMSRRTGRILVAVVALAAVISAVGAFAVPGYGDESSRSLWLSQFEGGPVTVTFISAPPEKSRIMQAKLISAEISGLVLRFPKERDKFFSYACIISVDPK